MITEKYVNFTYTKVSLFISYMQRRSFIEMFIAGTTGIVGFPEIKVEDSLDVKWKKIKNQFPDSSSKILNLNNGSAGMVPKVVEQELQLLSKTMNRMAPYEAQRSWEKINEQTRHSLANLVDADADEVAIVRNTTEALNFVFRGIDIPKNSTVICAKHDYGHAVNILTRLSKEKDFRVKLVELPLPATNQEVINAYKEKIDDSCSLVLLTAMVHREGQILPIKKLTKLAKKHGAMVVVDAAHAIGQYEHSVKDWDCDYYCTSLHKWLSCPIGSGLLYMKRELIERTKGSYSTDKKHDHKMIKFEDVGTTPFAIKASILSAIHFQESIGLKAKTKRLKALTDYWIEGVKEIPGVDTFKAESYGAVAAFYFPLTTGQVMNHLESQKIHVKKVSAKTYPTKNKVRYRVSPNIYHDFKDLDRLIDAAKTM